jgi:hypothetical protein
MTELKFDHTKDADFLEILGMSEKDMKDLNKKFASMSSFIVSNSPKKSELIEKIAETFSYNELLLGTALFVVERTAQIVQENPMVALLGGIIRLKERGVIPLFFVSNPCLNTLTKF